MKYNFLNYNYLIIFLLLLFYSKNNAQSNNTEMALYNIGLGSLFSGVGALINKEKNEKWHKVFFKGMSQGAIGGYLVFESKKMVSKIESRRSWEYSWYAKIINSAGTSIIENAASNRNFYDLWHINIGFNRFEIDTRNEFRLNYKLMPVSFILTAYSAINYKFEPKTTLKTGEFVFLSCNTDFFGLALGNVIIMKEININEFETFSHELIHAYQYYDYNIFNSYFIKPLNKLNFKSVTFKNLSKYLYYDFQGAVLRPLYLLENQNRNCFYDNFFENEAGFYSNTINCN